MPLLQIASTKAPGSGLPVVLIDSTAVAPGELPSESLILDAVSWLPQTDHIVIFFASGAPKTPNMPWLLKSYRLLSREAKKRIQRVFMVHERWWVKTFTSLLGNVVSPKFQRKLVHIPNLSELAKHIDITVLNISPAVYLYDHSVQEIISVPKHIEPVFGLSIDHPRGNMVYDHCIRYLHSVEPREFLDDSFKSTKGSPLSQILIQAVARGQMLNLQDYGPRVVISLVKYYWLELRRPILSRGLLADHAENHQRALRELPSTNHAALAKCVDWLHQLHRSGFETQLIVTEILPFLTQNLDSEPEFHELQFLHVLIEDWPRISQPDLANQALPSLPPRPITPPPRNSSWTRSRSLSPQRGKALQELPLPNANRVLRPKTSLANIRGPKIAEIVKTYEERLDDMGY
ncbi:Protein ECM25 [Wickerhamiella sorbophila]|uniref:Protein ECM25 n=1 Tax=Wickerhamiella sorbophila TaxID=45607 RepID=A0A2T0FBW7_9ASCO|nr:Protein ECM25 [Wickerhamiella sorbophila]PRT52504.1 Protein ECM25 [Wickerhamiella sorbophila]